MNGGAFKEFIDRCIAYGGADSGARASHWGAYTGTFDAEVMQRVIIEAIDAAGMEVLLRAHVIQAIMEGARLKALEARTKSGSKLIVGKVFIDASGDGVWRRWPARHSCWAARRMGSCSRSRRTCAC